MLENDAEYKELVKRKYNEQIRPALRSPVTYRVWQSAFSAGFRAARTPEEDERLKKESLEKHELEKEVRW
jgi:hypothetical protein